MIKINLLPGKETLQQQQIKLAMIIYFSVFLILTLSFVGIHQSYSFKNEILNKHIEVLRQQLAAKSKSIPAKEPIEFAELKHQLKNQFILFKILGEVFHLKIMGINLQIISHKAGNIVFKGQAYSEGNIRDFMSALLSINKIHAVKFDSIKQENNIITFQIHISELDI